MINAKIMFIVLTIFFVSNSFAEENAKSAQKPNILDFEADVIEGKKAKPDLFLQMDNGKQNLDSLIYMRSDFNDFQQQDMRRLRMWGSVK